MEKIALKNLTKTLLRGLISGEESGYIRLPRQLMEGLFSQDPAEQKLHQVYVALITHACYANTVVNYRRHKYYLNEGEIITSFRKLASVVGFHFMDVSRIIKWMEEQELIQTHDLGSGQLIRVNHYRDITRGVFKPQAAPQEKPAASSGAPLYPPRDPALLQQLREEYGGKF